MKNADRPAFPKISSSQEVGGIKFTSTDGLTKREYFAITLLQGILSRPPKQDSGLGGGCTSQGNRNVDEALKNADDLIIKLGE